MPIETAVVVSAIIVPFAIFAVVLAWGEMQTRGIRAKADSFEVESRSQDQIERMAQDFGLSTSDLRALASGGPNQGNLLLRRLAALRLDADELVRFDPAMFRDLQRVCTTCRSPRRCARDLKWEPNTSQDWLDYCPNAAILNMLCTLQSCSDDHKHSEIRGDTS